MYIDSTNLLEYVDIFPLSTLSDDIIFGKIKWEAFVVDDVTTQPPPLCGPNIVNSSAIVLLERNENILYNISISRRTCSQEVMTTFSLNCPLLLNVSVFKFTVFINGTMTALVMSNNSEVFACINHVWLAVNGNCKLSIN